MNYLKYFKQLNESKDNDWRTKLNWFLSNYKSKQIDYINVEFDEDGFDISWSIEGDPSYNGYFVRDGKKLKDGKNKVNYTVSDFEIISDEEFNKYNNQAKKISNYLDDNENVSNSSIGDGLELDFDESDINKMMAQDEIKKNFKNFLGKEYQFEADYNQWDGPSSNERIIKDIKLEITDVTGNRRERGRDGNPDFYLMFRCNLGDDKMEFMVSERSPDEYNSIDSIPLDELHKKTMTLNYYTDDMTRVQKRERKKITYPHITNYNIVPSDWPAIEFMKECTRLIELIMNEMK